MSEIEVEVNGASDEQSEKIRQLEERLDRMERERNQRQLNLSNVANRLVPPEVRQHLRAARREQLLAARAWLDAMINQLDESGQKSGTRRRIDVE